MTTAAYTMPPIADNSMCKSELVLDAPTQMGRQTSDEISNGMLGNFETQKRLPRRVTTLKEAYNGNGGFDEHRIIPRRRLRRLVLDRLLPITTEPWLNLIKAWADCHHCRHENFKLPDIRLRNLMWDPSCEEGVLTDFDLEYPSKHSSTEGGGTSIVTDLLECKEVCDNRSKQLARDIIEPYTWMIISAYIDQDVLFRE
ncbi:hypothetical protein FPV67DRAFT_1508823 [Lyophyllum atratum]|nr:hypothetical protein FPV67DRAFT_1508823 [Lyophyllum atratum]